MKRETWDLYAPVYKRAMRGDERAYRFMYERIPATVKGKRVLEVATGPGLLARHVAPATESMVATDYSAGMIREAAKGDVPDNLRFEVADAQSLPYEDASFDAVIIANALHIMGDPDRALEEIGRVMRRDGVLIAPNFINHDGGNPLWMAVLKIAGVSFEHRWSEETYLEYLALRGWDVTFHRKLPARITVLYTECVRGDGH